MKIHVFTALFCLFLCSGPALAQVGKAPALGQTGISAPPMPVEDSKSPSSIHEENSKLPKDIVRRRNAMGGKPIFTVEVKKGLVIAAHDRCAQYAIADLLNENNKTLKKDTLPKMIRAESYVAQFGDSRLLKPVVLAADQEASRKSEYWQLELEFGEATLLSFDGSDEEEEDVAVASFQVPIEFHNMKDQILAKVTAVECTINPKFFGNRHEKNLKVKNLEGAVIINEDE